jgi:ABC-type Fe3+/spermidine/putrescine transport system ATPase subunit
MQGYSLFTHLTSYENVAYPLRTKMHRCSPSDLRQKVLRMFELTGLSGLENRKPHEMSGGQQQRVALARALVFDPDLLLLDEPLGALDRELRERMELEIRKLQRMLRTTILYVTHDQGEAMRVADRIAILRAGKIVQIGTPVSLYQQPASRFVADFLGGANFLEGIVARLENGRATLQTTVGELWGPRTNGMLTGERRVLMVRPEQIHLEAPSSDYNKLSGILVDMTFLGNMWRATATVLDNTLWQFNLVPEQGGEKLRPEQTVDLYWKVSDTQLLMPDQDSAAKENDNEDTGLGENA